MSRVCRHTRAYIHSGGMSILEMRDVTTHRSKGFAVLNHVNLDLYEGEVHAIVGENGAGKSSLVGVLAGLCPLGSGMMILYGRPLAVKGPGDAQRNGLGFVYQDPQLLPQLSVAENILLGRLPTRWRRRFVHWAGLYASTETLLRDLGIRINPRDLVKDLNLEERQLVAIARAFSTGPRIVVMDEPVDNLGELAATDVFRVIRRYAAQGVSFLYFSHRLEEAFQVADRMTILKDGEVRETLSCTAARRAPDRIIRLMMGREDPVGESIVDGADTGGVAQQQGQDILRETGEVIQAILRTSELLASEYELQDILTFLAERAVNIMNADSCVIELIDEDSRASVNKVRFNRGEEITVDVKREILGRVISGAAPFFISDLGASEFMDVYAREPKPSVRSLICVPIKVRTRIAGAIEVFYRSTHLYSRKEIELLSAFASQAAIAIENTRLMGRSALLKEAHHRIKNNLQSIVSLLTLQMLFKESRPVEAVLRESIARVKAIAAVHDLLSKDEKGIGVVNAREIVRKVIELASGRNLSRSIQVRLDGRDIMMTYRRATSLALAVNELIINCFKHAFPDRDAGSISISMDETAAEIVIEVLDDGVGLPPEFDARTSAHLGLSIVKTLVSKDLQGCFSIERLGPGGGTRATIRIPGA